MYLLLALQLPTERLFLLQTCALAKWRERLLSLNTAATCCYRLSAGGGLGYTMDVYLDRPMVLALKVAARIF